MSGNLDPLLTGPRPSGDSRPGLWDIASAGTAVALILSPSSKELSVVTRSYAGGRVRQFSGTSGVTRTEIDLPDGRVVSVHKNVQPVMDLAAARFDSVVVSAEGEDLGTIELRVNPGTSPTNPAYIATLGGRKLGLGACGGSLDLALADDLLQRAVSVEEGYVDSHGNYGSPGYIAHVVSAMTPGYSVADLDPQLFVR